MVLGTLLSRLLPFLLMPLLLLTVQCKEFWDGGYEDEDNNEDDDGRSLPLDSLPSIPMQLMDPLDSVLVPWHSG